MMESVFVSYAVAEQGDSSSAEEVESPRSVVTVRRRCGGGRWRKSRHQNSKNKSNSNLNISETNNNNDGDDGDDGDKNGEKCYLHSQVLRIKEEELQIEEALMGDFGIFNVVCVVDSQPLDDNVSTSKIMLPASPLGSKKNDNNY